VPSPGCELSRCRHRKFLNPIKQDTRKKGKLRVATGFNMKLGTDGMFPQTWEDPPHALRGLRRLRGCTNDPVDVVEIGEPVTLPLGAVYAVKPIAALAMIDGEVEPAPGRWWQSTRLTPRCALVQGRCRSGGSLSGELSAIREWFPDVQDARGEALDAFELNEEFVGRSYTMDVIVQTHESWKALIMKSRKDRYPREGGRGRRAGDHHVLRGP